MYNSHLCIFLLFPPATFQPTSLTNKKKKISLFIHLHTHLCLHNQSTIPSSYVLFPWDSHDYEVFWVNVLKLRPYQSWDPDYDVLLCVTTPIWFKSQDLGWDDRFPEPSWLGLNLLPTYIPGSAQHSLTETFEVPTYYCILFIRARLRTHVSSLLDGATSVAPAKQIWNLYASRLAHSVNARSYIFRWALFLILRRAVDDDNSQRALSETDSYRRFRSRVLTCYGSSTIV